MLISILFRFFYICNNQTSTLTEMPHRSTLIEYNGLPYSFNIDVIVAFNCIVNDNYEEIFE